MKRDFDEGIDIRLPEEDLRTIRKVVFTATVLFVLSLLSGVLTHFLLLVAAQSEARQLREDVNRRSNLVVGLEQRHQVFVTDRKLMEPRLRNNLNHAQFNLRNAKESLPKAQKLIADLQQLEKTNAAKIAAATTKLQSAKDAVAALQEKRLQGPGHSVGSSPVDYARVIRLIIDHSNDLQKAERAFSNGEKRQ